MAVSSADQSAVTSSPPPAIAFDTGSIDTRFGSIALGPKQQLTFRGGLPGFPDIERFQLSPIPGVSSDLLLLHDIDTGEPGFVVMPLPSTAPVIADSDIGAVCRTLDIAAGDLLLLAIVTMTATPQGVRKFANLRAPLFVDIQKRKGAQIVLANAAYSLRYELNPLEAAA